MTIHWKAVEQCCLFFSFMQVVSLGNLSVLDLTPWRERVERPCFCLFVVKFLYLILGPLNEIVPG